MPFDHDYAEKIQAQKLAAAPANPVDCMVSRQEPLSVEVSHIECIELAKRTDYAHSLSEEEDPVNWGDAGAFFLEGMAYAIKLLERGQTLKFL